MTELDARDPAAEKAPVRAHACCGEEPVRDDERADDKKTCGLWIVPVLLHWYSTSLFPHRLLNTAFPIPLQQATTSEPGRKVIEAPYMQIHIRIVISVACSSLYVNIILNSTMNDCFH